LFFVYPNFSIVQFERHDLLTFYLMFPMFEADGPSKAAPVGVSRCDALLIELKFRSLLLIDDFLYFYIFGVMTREARDDDL
jgi:hypothetical protein